MQKPRSIEKLLSTMKYVDGGLAVISLCVALFYLQIGNWTHAFLWALGCVISTFAYFRPPAIWLARNLLSK